MFSKLILLILTTLTITITTTAHLIKRDNPMHVQAFKSGNKPTGDAVEVDDVQKGSVANVVLACGTIKVTANSQDIVTCDFKLPATLTSGTTFTGNNLGRGTFSLEVPGACAGAVTEVTVANECTGCGDIGEIPNLPECGGQDKTGNIMDLCVSGTNLVKC